MPSLNRCCGTSVGVVIRDKRNRFLVMKRGWFPAGYAFVGGHDDHPDSVVAEVREEVGLTVTSYEVVARDFWLPNLCASPPSEVPGHHWVVADAQVEGEVNPDPVETDGAEWMSTDQMERLIERTLDWARDRLSDEEFEAQPGFEPVWIELLHRAGLRPATPTERTLARRLYTTPPHHYWDDANEREVPVEEYVGCA